MSSDENEPVHLIEDEETGDRFLVYDGTKGLRLDIRFDGDTLWMTQAQIGELFGRDRTVITKHINNILTEGELDERSSVQKMHTTTGRPAALYSLDMVISVGYRVSSAKATLFRRWATGVLVQYARKGFVVDRSRLRDADDADRIAELREIIRDLRSDEANLYRELRHICAMCQDYDGKSDAAREFYQRTQAKLIYAVVSQTPAEVIASRGSRGAKHGSADVAERQCSQTGCVRFQKLPLRRRNPRAQSSDDDPVGHIRGPARHRQACRHGRCTNASGSSVARTRPGSIGIRRFRENG